MLWAEKAAREGNMQIATLKGQDMKNTCPGMLITGLLITVETGEKDSTFLSGELIR